MPSTLQHVTYEELRKKGFCSSSPRRLQRVRLQSLVLNEGRPCDVPDPFNTAQI